MNDRRNATAIGIPDAFESAAAAGIRTEINADAFGFRRRIRVTVAIEADDLVVFRQQFAQSAANQTTAASDEYDISFLFVHPRAFNLFLNRVSQIWTVDSRRRPECD